MDCQFWNMVFSFKMVIFLFSYHAYSIYKVRKPRMSKLGHTTLYDSTFIQIHNMLDLLYTNR